MGKKISVIVPVYNVEEYIENCVKSIQNQTYKDLEIILVDDGSTDESGAICDRLRESDDRIIVIHKNPNEGVSVARNSGFEVSTGDYISFVDSDDSIAASAFETLVSVLEKNDLDVIAFQYYINSETSEKKDGTFSIVSREEALERCVNDDDLKCFIPAVWNKLYRRDKVGQYLKFNPDYIMAEDMLVTIKVLKNAERIGAIECEFYNYTQRKESITKTYKRNKCSSVNAHEEMYDELKDGFPEVAQKIKMRSVEQAFSLLYEAMNTKALYIADIIVLACYLIDNFDYVNQSEVLNKKHIRFIKLVYGRKISERRICMLHNLIGLKRGLAKCYINKLCKNKKTRIKMIKIIKKCIPVLIKQAIIDLFFKYCEYACRKSLKKNSERNIILLADNVYEKEAYPIDNITLFKYIQEHKECGFESVYIIKDDNGMAYKLKQQYGSKILLYSKNSFSFYLSLIEVFKKTRYLCDSFQLLNSWIYECVKKSKNVDSIFTQHGINFFKDDFITPDSYGQNIYDKVMISNDLEEKIFITKAGFDEKNIIKNGMFRWDNIKNNAGNKNIVFVYITFRKYLRDMLDEGEISNCRYIKTVKDFLNSQRLHEILAKNNIELKIGMHHVLLHEFGKELFGDFQIVSEEEIGTIKQEAKLLITDYSSMCFEVLQQQKPVIFYNIHDDEDCIKYNYSNDKAYPYKGREQYLYNLADSLDDLLDIFEKIVANNFEITEQEEKINNQFFYYRDNYCERFLTCLEESGKIR